MIKLRQDDRGSVLGWYPCGSFTDLFVELQNNPNKGKFYMTIFHKAIWFEQPRDAVWFMLTHL